MKISSKLIDSYLNDTCTAHERELLHEWFNSFENDDEPLSYLSATQQEELNRRMLHKIDENILSREISSQKKPKRFNYIGIGMAATLFMVLGSFLFRTEKPAVSKKINLPTASELVMVRNPSKIMKRQLLPDGTSIWLKPNSKITYAKNIAASKFREVTLSGEAFFDVKRDTLHPFIIKTGHINTKVLGTSFNIKAYDGADQAEVSVITGKVLVYLDKRLKDKGTSEVYLLPNQKAVYSKTTTDLHKENDRTLRIWEKDTFTFNDTPLSEVVNILEQHFKVKIEIENTEVRKYTLKADFNKQNLPDILELLSKSMDLNYEISDKQVRINENK
ncbi:FecR family protein [Pedobacter sp. ok626]|uniref:FecR family protein n=1 Tax=Pedobacter sp. ok626 TaxID=1761882 RepID=UPI0008882E8C|nr:FecR family protein [Pedobacter sp. ok626]SDL42010.1 FecR family protein [Pedobacter sp. ok626]